MKVVAFLDDHATRSGDMLRMKAAADKHGLTISALVVGGADRGVTRDGLVTIVTEMGDGMSMLLIPGLDHLGDHLEQIRRYVAVRTVIPDELLPRTEPGVGA